MSTFRIKINQITNKFKYRIAHLYCDYSGKLHAEPYYSVSPAWPAVIDSNRPKLYIMGKENLSCMLETSWHRRTARAFFSRGLSHLCPKNFSTAPEKLLF